MFQQVCFSSISETSSFEQDDLRKKKKKEQTQEFLFQGPSYQSFLLPWGKVVSLRKTSNVPPTLFSAGSGVEVFSPFLGNLWKWDIISIIRIEEKSWNIQNIASEQLNQDKQKEKKPHDIVILKHLQTKMQNLETLKEQKRFSPTGQGKSSKHFLSLPNQDGSQLNAFMHQIINI